MSEQRLMTAIVADNNDPEKQGRVLLTLSSLPGGTEVWAKMVTPMAGPGRGVCLLPEVGDEVLAAFIQGDLSSAYVLGSVWGAKKKPPADVGKNRNGLKMIMTRSGNVLEFNDVDGDEHISLKDKNDNEIRINTADDSIVIISISKMQICTDGEMVLSGDKIRIAADRIEIKADASLTLDGGGTAELKAGTVNIN